MVYYQFTPDTYFTNFLVKRGLLHLHSDRLRVWQELTNPNWRQLHNGLLMTDADVFVEYLHRLIDEDVGIAIIPDYDTDGICSGTVLYQALHLFGCKNIYLYCPSMADGYGLSQKSIDTCLDEAPFNVGAIITTDNGIKAFDGIQYAKDKGLIVLVSDHHIGDEKIEPIADVLVNPNRKFKQDYYPYPSISGTVVIWKLLIAYALKYSSVFVQQAIFDLVVFAGLSTISDVMPLENENRTMVQMACHYLSDRKWLWNHVYETSYPISYRLCFLGLLALLDTLSVTGKIGETVTSDDLGFYLSPLLNTPRRVEQSSERGFRLFNSFSFDRNYMPTTLDLSMPALDSERVRLTDEMKRPYQMFHSMNQSSYDEQAILCILGYAEQLYLLNQVRKDALDGVSKRVTQYLNQLDFNQLVQEVVLQVPMSHGLVGLIAGRLMNHYRLPFIVFGQEVDGCVGGSARSPEDFNIYELLTELERAHPEYFKTWGGHAQAAGLTIDATQFDAFRLAFSELVVRQMIQRYGSIEQYQHYYQRFIPKTREYFIWSEPSPKHWFRYAQSSSYDWYDVQFTDNDTLLSFISMVKLLEPFGQGFGRPDFAFSFSLSKYDYERQFRLIGKEKNHAKLTLRNSAGVPLDCLTWRTGEKVRYHFDQYFKQQEYYVGVVSGQLNVNEFNGRYSLQLLNASYSENF